MRLFLLPFLLTAALCTAVPAAAKHHHHADADTAGTGPADATLLVVRHAEKPAAGDPGLSPAGRTRADAYAAYFQHLQVDGAPVHIDTLIASADSKESARPRLTLEPLGKAIGVPIQTPFADKQVKDVARWIAAGQSHRTALIAWHHGKLVKLLDRLGADTPTLLPDGDWPDDVYDWLIVLRYDASGQLSEAKRIVEPAVLK